MAILSGVSWVVVRIKVFALIIRVMRTGGVRFGGAIRTELPSSFSNFT